MTPLSILIIDDTLSDHHLWVEYLGGDGEDYRFLHAYSGKDGLAQYRDQSVDCILLDYNLPDMNGLEVLERLVRTEKNIPVIMMTGEGSEMIAVTAMKLGSQDYIPKKVVTPGALRRAIESTARHTELLKTMERYRADMERSNRDLELFANIVAHDLKSPLRAITQHLALIKNKLGGTLEERSQRSLDFAVDGACRMHTLIETLFTYAKLGFSEPQLNPVSLSSVLRNVLRDLSVSIEETGATIAGDDLPEVEGDASLLSQLLQNLIGNALKYCSGTPHVSIHAIQHGDEWRISVQDNGIGISFTQYEKVFTIFRRLHTQEEYPGIGLGLAVCDRIVKQHGGRIWVESEPGAGSTFYFTLPVMATVSHKKVMYG